MSLLNKIISDEDMVEVLYNTILERRPDEGGFVSNTSRIANIPRKDALNIIVKSFLNPEEYKTKSQSKGLALKLIPNNNLISNKTTINHIISLGTHCYTSQLLKQAGLKSYSCPFDWIFSSPSMLAHVIDDDFDKFLDRTFYKNIPTDTSRISGGKYLPIAHEFYLNNFSVTDVFNHHDVRIEEDYKYFVRSVERFRKVLLSSEPVMFVVCTRHTHDALTKFEGLSKSILKRKRSSVYLRYISIDQTNNPLPECELLDNSQMNFELFHFKSSSRWRDLYFENFLDDMALLNILSRDVNFDLKKI